MINKMKIYFTKLWSGD